MRINYFTSLNLHPLQSVNSYFFLFIHLFLVLFIDIENNFQQVTLHVEHWNYWRLCSFDRQILNFYFEFLRLEDLIWRKLQHERVLDSLPPNMFYVWSKSHLIGGEIIIKFYLRTCFAHKVSKDLWIWCKL